MAGDAGREKRPGAALAGKIGGRQKGAGASVAGASVAAKRGGSVGGGKKFPTCHVSRKIVMCTNYRRGREQLAGNGGGRKGGSNGGGKKGRDHWREKGPGALVRGEKNTGTSTYEQDMHTYFHTYIAGTK